MHTTTTRSQYVLPLQGVLVKEQDDWTFNGASTRTLTHCFHDYPARMIPQIASKLLDKFGGKAKLLFDPYCGTGTSQVEAVIRGIDAIGTDLNPLARLIAQAKTSIPNRRQLDNELKRFYKLIAQTTPKDYASTISQVHGITRLDFWFKPVVVRKLSYLRSFIDEIKDKTIRTFFQVAFSETVRDSSNTRSEEFKLYRYDEERLRRFNPDVFGIMCQKLQRNRPGLESFLKIIEGLDRQAVAHIYDFNTVNGIPSDYVEPSSVDIVITSPPYGDSHTTVAYGQYSRLSAAWLGLSEPANIDNKLMGGKVYKQIPDFPCEKLNTTLSQIRKQDEKRAREVASFYLDLQESIANVAKAIRHSGYACYVVGNRKVKGLMLPTDDAIRCLFENHSFRYVDTFLRSIPNKRMPLRNSPTNIAGALDNTMVNEFIVVMQKR